MIKQLQQQINTLVARQKDLQLTMAKSDARASKCSKLGLSFAETYPDDLAEYQAANASFNENEATIEHLRQQLSEAQAAAEEQTVED